jgi:zinc transport system substrate-binding protein
MAGRGGRAATRAWLLAMIGLSLACGAAPESDPRPVVAVSVLPQRWFVEQLAGDRVRVEVMIPPGASPATHEPGMGQLRALSEAILYVKVGHPHFPFEEAWLGRLLADAGEIPVVDASAAQGVDAEGDPHLWLAPAHARALARAIHAALRETLPGAAAALDANLAALLAEIDAVDAELGELLGPRRGAAFVVFHAAWGHLASAYGLEQLAIETGHREPDPRHLAEVIERSRKLGVRTVFAQPQFDERPARVVADAIGARVESLDPLAYDWPANLRHVGRRLAAESRA